MTPIDRNTFIQGGLALSAGLAFVPWMRNANAAAAEKTAQPESNGFFTLGKN